MRVGKHIVPSPGYHEKKHCVQVNTQVARTGELQQRLKRVRPWNQLHELAPSSTLTSANA